MNSAKYFLAATLALSLAVAYGCAAPADDEQTEAAGNDNGENELQTTTGPIDNAGIVESTTMMLRDDQDGYNRQDPFRINPQKTAAVFKDNLAKFDAIDGKTDWTPENSAKWIARMSSANYLVVDTSKPCAFGKPSYLDIEREQMGGPAHTTCGGRTPSEDALDVTFSWLIRAKAEKAADLSDGVDNLAKEASPRFPYLAK